MTATPDWLPVDMTPIVDVRPPGPRATGIRITGSLHCRGCGRMTTPAEPWLSSPCLDTPPQGGFTVELIEIIRRGYCPECTSSAPEPHQ